jgi:hypothetical protein
MAAVRLGACNAIARVWPKRVKEVGMREHIADLEARLAG